MSKNNITDTNPIDNRLVLKNIPKTNNQKKKNNSTVKSISFKPINGDKTFGLDSLTRFCEAEDGNKTKEVEEPETLVFHNSILVATKENLEILFI